MAGSPPESMDWARRAHPATAAAWLAVLACLVATSCTRSATPSTTRSSVRSAAISPSGVSPGCKPGEQNRVVAIEVQKGPGGSTVALVPIYIDSHGPFRFTLDTGASRSLVDRSVVDELHLKILGPAPGEVAGLFGTSKAQLVRVDRWRAGEVELPSKELLTASIDQLGPEDGLLGSDILSTFHAVTIDYRGQLLVLCD